jgi:hypothetical protein
VDSHLSTALGHLSTDFLIGHASLHRHTGPAHLSFHGKRRLSLWTRAGASEMAADRQSSAEVQGPVTWADVSHPKLLQTKGSVGASLGVSLRESQPSSLSQPYS